MYKFGNVANLVSSIEGIIESILIRFIGAEDNETKDGIVTVIGGSVGIVVCVLESLKLKEISPWAGGVQLSLETVDFWCCE